MAKRPHTTNPSDERNTPRGLIFDMEEPIATMRRHARTLLLISATDGIEDVVQDALAQVAYGMLDCHRDLHDKFSRLFDQIVRDADDKPEPDESIDDLFAEWNANRQQSQGGISDEQAELLNEQELILMEKIIAAPATSAGDIAAKVIVAKELIEQSGSRWSDERDVKVLDSIQRDLTQFGSVLRAQEDLS